MDQLTRAFTVLGRALPRHGRLSAVVVAMLAAAPDTALPAAVAYSAHDAVALLEGILRRARASIQHDGATVARLHTNLAARLLAVRDWGQGCGPRQGGG